MDYNYLDSMKDDINEYIKENVDLSEWADNRDGLEEHLNEVLWTEDSVTGNEYGSYTLDPYDAEEYLAHNYNLLNEALSEFGFEGNPLEKGPEWCDVTIRCYLLGQAISEVLDEAEI